MLGTLEEEKNLESTLVHAYNATRHDSTGYTFNLMFDRHPCLAIDAYLGLYLYADQYVVMISMQKKKIFKSITFPYRIASREADRSVDSYKSHFDSKVRKASVYVGDRVLN